MYRLRALCRRLPPRVCSDGAEGEVNGPMSEVSVEELGKPNTESLEEELEQFRSEKEKIRQLVGRIGGVGSTKRDWVINVVFIVAILALLLVDMLRHLIGFTVPLPALFSIVDDFRARFGKLDVDGDKHPSLEATFAEQMCRLDGNGRSVDELET